MIERLIRICLAFAIAFVFTGRMEAAAEHCAQLAAAEMAEPAPEATMPCHGGEDAVASEAASHHSAPEIPASDICECLAVLKACSPIATAAASARIEPYEWVRPEAAAFASIEPAPALKPPRA